jgi:hypothetical protein
MSRTGRRFQLAAARLPRENAQFRQLIRVLALIGLCMLPVEMRAGTEHPHPHALFQLLLDASDGVFDHHQLTHDEDAAAHDPFDTSGASDTHRPDVPTFGDTVQASGGLAVLLTLLTLLLLPPADTVRVWPTPPRWRGRIPALEPPPPRWATA